MMTRDIREQNKQIAVKWFGAFNAHDLDGLLSLYHKDAEHYSPKLKVRRPESEGMVRGHAELRGWWQDAFTRLPSLRYETKMILPGDDAVFMEYTRRVDGEDDMMVGEVLEIRHGLIVRSRVYHG